MNAATTVDQHSPPSAKIALFRSLFRGREDDDKPWAEPPSRRRNESPVVGPLDAKTIGRVGGGRKKPTGRLMERTGSCWPPEST